MEEKKKFNPANASRITRVKGMLKTLLNAKVDWPKEYYFERGAIKV
jgi:hypothetical protein